MQKVLRNNILNILDTLLGTFYIGNQYTWVLFEAIITYVWWMTHGYNSSHSIYFPFNIVMLPLLPQRENTNFFTPWISTDLVICFELYM